ncbi:MAG: hypothetical protein Q9M26_06065 [Mariprofundales bacterium]|nr:hypothetical protein [Mariprofundales bacterium]
MGHHKGKTRAPDCMRCRHLFITWQPQEPYGCRSFGFQSKRVPSMEVKLASGEQCLRFEAKPAVSEEAKR